MLSSQWSVSSVRASRRKKVFGKRERACKTERKKTRKGSRPGSGSHRREIARMTPEVAGIMYADVVLYVHLPHLSATLSAILPLFLVIPFVLTAGSRRATTYKDVPQYTTSTCTIFHTSPRNFK